MREDATFVYRGVSPEQYWCRAATLRSLELIRVGLCAESYHPSEFDALGPTNPTTHVTSLPSPY